MRADGQPLHTIPSSRSIGMAFSPDGRIVAGGAIDGDGVHVRLWDVASGRSGPPLPMPADAIGHSCRRKDVVTLTAQVLRLLRNSVLGRGDRHTAIDDPIAGTLNAVLSPDGTQLATSSWSAPSGCGTPPPESSKLAFPEQTRAGLAFSPDGKRLAAGERNADRHGLGHLETGRRLVQDAHSIPSGASPSRPTARRWLRQRWAAPSSSGT